MEDEERKEGGKTETKEPQMTHTPDQKSLYLVIIGSVVLMMLVLVFGVKYIFKESVFPIPLYIIYFIFSIGIIIFATFLEKEKGAIYPWSLMGGTLLSACLTFILTTLIGLMRYILEKGFKGFDNEVFLYAFAICAILSIFIFFFIRNKF